MNDPLKVNSTSPIWNTFIWTENNKYSSRLFS